MEDSWDWLDKHKKKERQRKRFYVFCLVIAVPALLITIPSMLSVPDSDPNNAEQFNSTKSPAAGEPQPAVADRQLANVNQSTDADKSSVQPPVVEDTTDSQASSADDVAQSNTVDRNSAALPQEEPIDHELVRRSKNANARLLRALDQIGEERLNRHGGEPWEKVKALRATASNAEEPSAALAVAEDALERIDALALHVDTAELLAKTDGESPTEVLAAFVRFREKHPQHPPVREMDDRISKLPRATWLAMAADELENASPDDSGFAEGWLPIAGAWQLAGEDAEAREAIRRAREALPRMALVERVIESTIDLCQHESFDPAFSEQLINEAAQMCKQVSAKWVRGSYYANLSGLAATLGHRSLAAKLLQMSIDPSNIDAEGSDLQRLSLIQQCRAAAWTEPPEAILAICKEIERVPYPKPVVAANGYAYAAIAAARHSDRTQFLRAMFQAETALAPVQVRDYPNYFYAGRLAEANLLQRRWRAAVIFANNCPDPAIRASILFRVMSVAPQEIRSPHLPELFERFADQRWACLAVAGHAEHRIRSGESLLDVAEWARKLPLVSQRASAYAGIARVAGSSFPAQDSFSIDTPIFGRPDIANTISLVEAAEQLAATIEDPLESAFAWLQIARTWNLLGKTQRYRDAVADIHNRIFDAWTNIWNARPPVKRSYNGGYIDSDDRYKAKEQETVGLILACLRHLSEMQADMGDARGAMDTCLDLASAAGFLSAMATYNDMNFLHLNAMAIRLQDETGVGTDAFPYAKHRSYLNTRALLAAHSHDLPGLIAVIPELTKNSERKLASPTERAQLARAYGELAILYAERGNIDSYRDARRSALSQITQGKAPTEMKCVLATADALAGEFALAESNLVRGEVRWFGDANRPRSQLAIALANDGQWDKAIDHVKKIPATYPIYRGDAWEAIAKARFKDEQEPRDELLDWVGSLNSPGDQVGAYCGLALVRQTSQP